MDWYGPGRSRRDWSAHDIARWFRRFGSYESGDGEFAASRRKAEGALRL